MFLINDVLAEEINATNSQFSNIIGSFFPILIFIFFFYFLLIRPQQKRENEHKKEIESLKKNDSVITTGGIFAKVMKKNEKSVTIEIASGVEIDVLPETLSLLKDEKKSSKSLNNSHKKK